MMERFVSLLSLRLSQQVQKQALLMSRFPKENFTRLKMFLAYGVKVTYLKRLTFGEFQLGDLPSGQYRELTFFEQESLKKYLD